jgi:hypothetical protein
MLTPVYDQQGLGLVVGGSTAHKYFNHGGANEGYRCYLVAYEDGSQFQCWPKSQACRQHEQHIRAEVPPSAFHERRDPRLSNPQLFSRLALSPAFLLDVLAQCRHQIGPHLEYSGLGFIEA